MATAAEELARTVDMGDLSRDYGLDITVSDGGMVTSALNQQQYRSQCNKLYQEFMLSMADYLLEEGQLRKKLQHLLVQKKQNKKANPDDDDDDGEGRRLDEADVFGDEDAFTPAQMDEFRRLANSRASNRSLGKPAAPVGGYGVGGAADHGVGAFGMHPQPPRPPTSASVIRAPSRAGGMRTETPHLFPAMKERPLITSTASRGVSRMSRAGSANTVATTGNKRHSLTSGANLYGGKDQEYDGVMDPTSEFSANRRMRMNPRAFSRLTGASSIKVKVMDRKGEFVMKPVTGRPGVVSINGGGDKDDGDKNPVMDSKDKMALIKTRTSFKTPTLASELKTNNLVAIQKSLQGIQVKRMTVTDVMSKSRDRRARLFRVQMSTGRMDDWDIPGEDRRRPPTRTTSASLDRGGPSRMGLSRAGYVDVPSGVRKTDSPSVVRGSSNDTPASRAKTAPATRPSGRSSSTPTSKPQPGGLQVPRGARDRSPSPFHRRPAPSPQPKLAVVQLELEQDAAAKPAPPQQPKLQPHSQTYLHPHSHHHLQPPPSPQPHRSASPGNRHHHPKSAQTTCSSAHYERSPTPRAVFPVSAQSLESSPYPRSRRPRQKSAAEEQAEKDCSIPFKHIHTLRESAAVVRIWKERDQDREDKLNKWRMRMSFAATRRGNLGKILAKV